MSASKRDPRRRPPTKGEAPWRPATSPDPLLLAPMGCAYEVRPELLELIVEATGENL